MSIFKTALVLDFDGPLAIPWVQPVKYHSQVPTLIKKLSQTYLLFLASKNPTAIETLKEHGLRFYFADVRAGSNDAWIGDFSDVKYRGNLAKSKQIYNMIGHRKDVNKIYFFDDDAENIIEVEKNCALEVKSVLVEQSRGLTENDVFKLTEPEKYTPTMMDRWNAIQLHLHDIKDHVLNYESFEDSHEFKHETKVKIIGASDLIYDELEAMLTKFKDEKTTHVKSDDLGYGIK